MSWNDGDTPCPVGHPTKTPDPSARRGLEEDEAGTCAEPCDPESGCEACDSYWRLMERQGFWLDGMWTDRGMREMLK